MSLRAVVCIWIGVLLMGCVARPILPRKPHQLAFLVGSGSPLERFPRPETVRPRFRTRATRRRPTGCEVMMQEQGVEKSPLSLG